MASGMTFCGFQIKVATSDIMEKSRRDGERIVSGESGYRLVSYYDRDANLLVVSHEIKEV
jgi:hypothetical protein